MKAPKPKRALRERPKTSGKFDRFDHGFGEVAKVAISSFCNADEFSATIVAFKFEFDQIGLKQTIKLAMNGRR